MTGTADAAWVAKAGVSAPGHERFVVTDEMAGTAAVTARVGDDARLRDYDLEVKFRTHMRVVRRDAAGKVVETNPPSLYTARIILRGLKPGMGYDALLGRMQGQLSGPPQAGIQGLAGPINRMGVRADDARRKLHVVLLALADHTGSELESAERRWQAGKCTSVRVSAAKAQVKAGASTQVTVRVSPPKGERLAAGRLDVSLSGPGTLRPSGRTRFDGGARRYTFTAAKKGWRKGAKADIRAKATSRQGVTLTGEATVGAKGAREELHFKVTALGGSYEMHYRAPGRLPGCAVTGEHGYGLGINPKAERDKTDGSVKLSAGVGLIRLPTLRTGAETYSATCDETMGHAADPCRGTIDAPDPLDWLNITRRKGSAAITFSAPQQLWGVPPSCSLWYHDGGALANRDHPRMQTTVPCSTVSGTRPFTVSVNDTQSDPNHTSTRSRTVTLQPVDKAGRALR